jgi:hypothetical protein
LEATVSTSAQQLGFRLVYVVVCLPGC